MIKKLKLSSFPIDEGKDEIRVKIESVLIYLFTKATICKHL